MGDSKRYQTKTVKAVRGTEDAVIAAREKRGWELVDRTPAVVRTTLTFRRRAPLVPHPVGLALLVVLLAVVIAVGVLMERDSRADSGGYEPGRAPWSGRASQEAVASPHERRGIEPVDCCARSAA